MKRLSKIPTHLEYVSILPVRKSVPRNASFLPQMHQNAFWSGSAVGDYSTPPEPLTGLKREGKERKAAGKGGERKEG